MDCGRAGEDPRRELRRIGQGRTGAPRSGGCDQEDGALPFPGGRGLRAGPAGIAVRSPTRRWDCARRPETALCPPRHHAGPVPAATGAEPARQGAGGRRSCRGRRGPSEPGAQRRVGPPAKTAPRPTVPASRHAFLTPLGRRRFDPGRCQGHGGASYWREEKWRDPLHRDRQAVPHAFAPSACRLGARGGRQNRSERGCGGVAAPPVQGCAAIGGAAFPASRRRAFPDRAQRRSP